MTTVIRLRRILIAGTLAVLASASTAYADSGASSPPTAAQADEVSAAHAAAAASLDTVGRFFAAGGQRPQAAAAAQEAGAKAAAPRLDSATVPVFYLSRAFVADPTTSAPAAPVADLAFFATDAVSAAGAHATVWTARDATGAFRAVNIASGSDEITYRNQAGNGATAFEEPEINAWYALRDGRILPLDDAARRSVGSGMSLADYHRLVRGRYADKLPGSAYDRAGIAGGFSPSGATAARRSRHTTRSQATAMQLEVAVACIVIGGAGVGFVLRRRVKQASPIVG